MMLSVYKLKFIRSSVDGGAMSIGTGEIIVLGLSDEMLTRVWRYRSL